MLDDTTDTPDPEDLVTLDSLKSIVARGQELPPNPYVDKLLMELEQKIKLGEDWEEKANICMQARCVLVLACACCTGDERFEYGELSVL